jgi:hypothetical protein
MVVVQEDDYKVVRGSAQDGSAEYEFSPKPNGSTYVFCFNRKSSKWCEMYRHPETKRLKQLNGRGLILGFRERYYDPCF